VVQHSHDKTETYLQLFIIINIADIVVRLEKRTILGTKTLHMLVSEIAYYHMKVEVLQTRDESPGDRFECCSHLGDILANICNALYHLWNERE